MRDQIWYELVEMKHGERYLAHYLVRLDSIKKWIRLSILFFAGGGIIGWNFWEPAAWIACGIIAFFQVLNLIENQLIRSDSEIKEIERLRLLYLKYFNELERIWIHHENNELKTEEVVNHFYDLRNKMWIPLEELDNDLKIRKYKRLVTKSENETDQYLKNYHNARKKETNPNA